MDEAAFIAALRGIATHPAARGLADDCAVLPLGGETLVLTHDMLVEGTHLAPGQSLADAAWKLVATNLSDLAAKGAQPIGVLVGHMLGDGDGEFLAGLAAVLAHYAVPLLGGDTVRGPAGAARAFGLTAIGRATHVPVPARSGARPGDALWLTGPVGAAMLGLEALRTGNGDATAYLRPVALLNAGRALAPHVTAMMDVSDGLLLDAARMARASAVTIAITAAQVPIATPEPRRHEALRWGDDYQLLFTLPPGQEPPVPAHRIGAALPQAETPLLLDTIPLTETTGLGYQH
ncbi:MAG: thiamine-phosphate kinase [Sphingomonadales bacterium]|nr:thiamine-phosphate kinase [Sphingomonadales bacterium]